LDDSLNFEPRNAESLAKHKLQSTDTLVKSRAFPGWGGEYLERAQSFHYIP